MEIIEDVDMVEESKQEESDPEVPEIDLNEDPKYDMMSDGEEEAKVGVSTIAER